MADASVPVLEVEDLSVVYCMRSGAVEAVGGVSFTIGQGEAFGLVGESGCGKSSIAWAIVHYLGKSGSVTGHIRFEGQDLVGQTEGALRTLRGDRISMVYQDPMAALNPSMRVGQQLKEALWAHGEEDQAAVENRCVAMLDRVHMPDPEGMIKRYPHQLSGGQQQRVVIAMALLNNPALLIMDEPTTALDVTVEAAVLDLVEELREAFDTAILFISHNLGVVSRVCDRVGVLYAGELVEQAPVRSLFRAPRHPYTQGLLRCIPRVGDRKSDRTLTPIPGRIPVSRTEGCAFAPRCGFAQTRCSEDAPELREMDAHQVRCHFAEEIVFEGMGASKRFEQDTEQEGEIDLEVTGLKTYYAHRERSLKTFLGLEAPRFIRAVDGVGFQIAKGKTLGVVGESGCGKSTLVRTLMGLERSRGGEAYFKGFDLTRTVSQRDGTLLKDLQMVFQNPDATLNPAYPVGDQIARAVRRFKTVPRDEVRSEVVRLLEAVRLDAAYYERYPQQLSGGEKQRVGIARAFASRPGLVLCDEPVSALDVSVQAAILNLLLEIQRDQGTTMIFIAHDLSVVRYFSDDVAVMYLGRVIEIGPAEAIYTPPYHPYTEALLSAIPIPDPEVDQKHIRLEGSVPSALDPPGGCAFHTRCPRRNLLPNGGQVCETEMPPTREFEHGHRILCHLTKESLMQLEPVVVSQS